MYIEYITPQQVADKSFTKYNTPAGDYRPTWLVRTSDWKRVPGDEATAGYHTLSYCWEQSGEMFKKDEEGDEYGLKDEGHHRLITFSLNEQEEEVPKTHEVTYDEILKRICKDFDIDYLWYDKICINQMSQTEKRHEIKQMHLIYSNALFTVALVPEVDVIDPEKFECIDWLTQYTQAKNTVLSQIQESKWWKRCWTLEELMMATRIVIVGRSTHMWSLAQTKQGDVIKETDFLSVHMLGFKQKKIRSANTVLRHAHFRTSSKGHDQIFALANIFDGILSIDDISYKSEISHAMNVFYQRLARRDLSILCFGSVNGLEGDPQYKSTMGSYTLPSWTGVSGLHSSQPVAQVVLDRNAFYTIGNDMRLTIKCKSYTIRPIKYEDRDVFDDNERTQQAQINHSRIINSWRDFDNEVSALDWSQWCMSRATSCYATHYWKPDQRIFRFPSLPLSLTEDCSECVILAVLLNSTKEAIAQTANGSFITMGYNNDYFLPVLKKIAGNSTYRAIGVILMKHFQCNEARKSPEKFLEETFSSNVCDQPKYFIIK